MTIRLRTTIGLLVTLVAWTAWGCGKSPAAPDPLPKHGVKALRLSGPASIAPGATGQFTAVAEYTDGTSADVTSTAIWQTTESSILVFPCCNAGRATAVRRGEVDVVSAIGGQGTGLHVMVLEPGTFRLSGTVSDDAGTIPNATVEVMSGIGTGLQVLTNELGRYAIYGVAGPVNVGVTADGFNLQTLDVVVGENAVADVILRPIAGSREVAGAWALTFTASAACSGQLPVIAREREFAVNVVQRGARLELHLKGIAGFLDGRLTGSSLGIAMEGDYGIYEEVAGLGTVGIDGIVTASVQNQEIRGVLDGAFRILDAARTTCRDRAHAFVMRRLDQ
jgi:hypothetical protein